MLFATTFRAAAESCAATSQGLLWASGPLILPTSNWPRHHQPLRRSRNSSIVTWFVAFFFVSRREVWIVVNAKERWKFSRLPPVFYSATITITTVKVLSTNWCHQPEIPRGLCLFFSHLLEKTVCYEESQHELSYFLVRVMTTDGGWMRKCLCSESLKKKQKSAKIFPGSRPVIKPSCERSKSME